MTEEQAQPPRSIRVLLPVGALLLLLACGGEESAAPPAGNGEAGGLATSGTSGTAGTNSSPAGGATTGGAAGEGNSTGGNAGQGNTAGSNAGQGGTAQGGAGQGGAGQGGVEQGGAGQGGQGGAGNGGAGQGGAGSPGTSGQGGEGTSGSSGQGEAGQSGSAGVSGEGGGGSGGEASAGASGEGGGAGSSVAPECGVVAADFACPASVPASYLPLASDACSSEQIHQFAEDCFGDTATAETCSPWGQGAGSCEVCLRAWSTPEGVPNAVASVYDILGGGADPQGCQGALVCTQACINAACNADLCNDTIEDSNGNTELARCHEQTPTCATAGDPGKKLVECLQDALLTQELKNAKVTSITGLEPFYRGACRDAGNWTSSDL